MIMKINLYEWLLNDYGIDVVREFAFNAMKQNPNKKMYDVFFELKKKLGSYNAAKTIFQTAIDLNEKYGYADVDWENDVSPNWKIYLMNKFSKGTDIELIWNIHIHDTETTLEEKEMVIVNEFGLDPIKMTEEAEKFIKAVSRKVYSERKNDYRYQDVLRAFINKYFTDDKTGELFGSRTIVGNIKFGALAEAFKFWEATDMALLQIIAMYRHGDVKSYYWVTEEARKAYVAWLEGGPKKVTFWKSNSVVIKFNAKTNTVKLNNIKTKWEYETTLKYEDII